MRMRSTRPGRGTRVLRRCGGPRLEHLEGRQLLASLFVTNTSGDPTVAGSLPFEVGAATNGDVIDFSKLGTGAFTIKLKADLTVKHAITIDGSTAVSWQGNTAADTDNATLAIQIDGAAQFGIVIAAAGVTVNDLDVVNYKSYGLKVDDVANATIKGDFVGVNPDGSSAPAGTTGILVQGTLATGVTIGGPTGSDPDARNVIRGTTNGISLTSSASSGLAAGNFVGVAPDGKTALSSALNGINIDNGANHFTIGGVTAGSGNIVSGNNTGIQVASADGAISIQNNFIGTDSTGTASLRNLEFGVVLTGSANNTIGGAAASARNVISANGVEGVEITGAASTNNLVQGNLIGTDKTGAVPLGNLAYGVEIEAGANLNTVSGNVISANGPAEPGMGVYLRDAGTSHNAVVGNNIGTDLTGTIPLGNTFAGVFIAPGASSNSIGGVAATIGTAPGNLISGNVGYGIEVDQAPGTVIEGNLIGPDSTGAAELANGKAGILLDYADHSTVGGNVISANLADGIDISGTAPQNLVVGNDIGTDSTGKIALGNAGIGVFIIGAADNTIGGSTAVPPEHHRRESNEWDPDRGHHLHR